MTREQVRSAVTSKASTPAMATGSAPRALSRKKTGRKESEDDEDDEVEDDDSDEQPTPSNIPVNRRAGANLGTSGDNLVDRARRLFVSHY